MPEFYALLIVAAAVIAVLWLDRQQVAWLKKLLAWFPAILFAYLVPSLITHLFDLDLSGVYLHTLSRNWIIPITIVTVMGALSVPQLRIVGIRPIILFVAGSAVIAVLPILLVWLFGVFDPSNTQVFIAEGFWKGLVPIVGGWIGGSTSQLVLKEVVECPESLFLSVLVLDNVLVNIWTILMFQAIQRSDMLNTWFGIDDTVPVMVDVKAKSQYPNLQSIFVTSVCIILCAAVTVLLVDSFLLRIIILSILGLLLGNLIPIWNHQFVLKAGGIMIIVVMAILGLRLNFENMSLPPVFVGVVLCWLVLHYVAMMVVAKLLRLHLAWVPIASMANLGGISTAPAVTSAYNKEWMPHAILLAILSMVTGTWWGLITIFLFGLF